MLRSALKNALYHGTVMMLVTSLRTLRRYFQYPSDLATLQENKTPGQATIAKSLALGAEIVRAVNQRERVVQADRRIEADFAMPAGNWGPSSENDFLKCYRLLASLNWREVRYLRLRAQNFSGKNLIAMRELPGSSGTDPIHKDFEYNWDEAVRAAIMIHWNSLIKDLPRNLIFRVPNMLGEVGWWTKGTIVNADVVDYQERINLLHLSGLLNRWSGKRPRILEIGGGYGALCYALRAILKPRQYVICDLPESLLFSGLYLSLCRAARVRLASPSRGLERFHHGEICLLPNYLAQVLLPGQSFDLVINTLSMSEMSARQVSTYGALISQAIGASGTFFEQNYDNRGSGMIDCREHLAPFFANKRVIDTRCIPTTRGEPNVWSN
jgi:hypothetical protein